MKRVLGALCLSAAGAFSIHAADVVSPGYLKFEYFGNISGTAVSGLTADPRYTANTPDVVLYAPSANSRTILGGNDHENYGARLSGFIIPEQTGDYDFFISSDDASQLWLSTDATTANLQKIAEETGCCNAFQEPGAAQTTAATVHLLAGQKYAIQALLKEGGGGDFVQIAWRNSGVDGTAAADLRPIPGRVLAASVPSAGSVTITSQPQSTSVPAGSPAFFSVGYNVTWPTQVGTPVGGMNTNAISIQWYRDGVPIESQGATGPTFAIPQVAATDAGAKFTAKIFVPGLATPVTTDPATLSISTTPLTPTPGSLMLEFYGDVGTATLPALTDSPRFQTNSPDGILWMTAFDSRTVLPDDGHENYGTRITGFIIPTETADYDFFLRSDDASQLWLSTDNTTANLAQIAEEAGCCNPFLEPVDATTGTPNAQTTASPIHLVAGQAYAVEAFSKEGGGGDYVQVAWRKTTDTTPAGQLAPIPGKYLASYQPAASPITVTQQPQNASVAENAPATFSVAYTAAPLPRIGTILPQGLAMGGLPAGVLVSQVNTDPFSVQWYENGVEIPGATGKTLTIPLAKPSDNNAKITAKITRPGATATSAEATLSVTADLVPPTLVSVMGDATLTNATLVFSEPITAATATALANYTFDGGLTVKSVTQVNPTTVRLGTSAQTSGKGYNLTINNLKDTAASGGGNVIAANTKGLLNSWVPVSGGLKVDLFMNINGTPVSGLTSDPRYPNNPDSTTFWTSFGPFSAGNNYGDNYGARITGFITPTNSGTYKFFLRSDDASELWLSTDENPANETKIAEQTSCCNAFTDAEGTLSSSPIDLVAGKRYYVEALLKEGGGDDYLQVAWNGPDAADINSVTGLAPIPGQFLQTYIDPIANVNITAQPTNVTTVANGPASFTIAYTSTNSVIGSSGSSVQWQKAPSGSTIFTNIPGATSTTFTIPFADPADSGAQYRAVVSVLSLTNVTSSAATLTLNSDVTPPTIVSVNGSAQQTVNIGFSEPLDASSAANKANYSIDKGVTVNSATVVANAGTAVVQLGVSGIQAGTSYTLTINNVKDRGNNALAGNTAPFTAYSAFYDFSSGTPAGTFITGSSGKILPDGTLQLTPAAGSMGGGFIVPDLSGGADVTNILIHLQLFLGKGSVPPADGFSISIANDITDDAVPSEEGTGTGIVFSFDTYDNGGGEAPAISVYVGGTETTVKTNVPISALVNDRWVDVTIRVNADGTVDLIHDGNKYFSSAPVDGLAPINSPRVAFGARTGGSLEEADIDNIGITVNAATTLPSGAGKFTTTTLSGGNLTINWTGGGTLQQATVVTGPYTDVAGASGTSYTTSTSGAAAKFFRLRP
jgi:hypothetical protein